MNKGTVSFSRRLLPSLLAGVGGEEEEGERNAKAN